MAQPNVKIVLIGEKDSGKQKIIEYYQPKTDSSSTKKEHTLQMLDKETREAWKVKARSQSPSPSMTFPPDLYDYAEVFLLCFSVMNRDSLKKIQEKWVPEIKKYAPNKPYILLGTQIEVRDKLTDKKAKKEAVSTKDGAKTAKKMKATKYMECSVDFNIGLKEVFDEVKKVIQPQKPKTFIRKIFGFVF